MNRRKFLKAVGGIVGFPYVVRAAALGLEGKTAASNRITVGCIGNGPQGNDVMRNLLSQDDCLVVAVCDVWKRARDAAKAIVDKRYEDNGCAVYSDFRELLARGDIDAVLIATPDHWHTIIGIEAAKAGKDMYIEKPMGHSIEENQILRDAVRRYKAVFQFGTQQRSDVNFRTACEAAANGRIGKLQTINVWAPASVAGGALAPAPVPEGLDYEMWTGPAQWMPYAEHRCDGTPNVKHWWYNSNYAMGFIAGWGIHPIDIAMWGGGKLVEGPIEIEGSGEFPKDGACDTAVKWKVAMKFGSGVVMNFVSTSAPEEWRRKYVKTKTTTHGTVFEGSDGWALVDRSGVYASKPEVLEAKANDIELYKSIGHASNFLDCVKSRAKTICPIDEAVRSDNICKISDIATRLERRLVWDTEKEQFVKDEQANRMARRAMRAPWRL